MSEPSRRSTARRRASWTRRALAASVAAGVLVVLPSLVDRPAPEPSDPGRPAAPAPALRIGLTEQSAALLRPAVAPAGAADAWRARVDALRPRLLRLMVDWSQLQPDPGRPPAWDRPRDGCMRGRPPCLPDGGVRDWLRAAAARDAEVLVSVYGTPQWAASAPGGCERPGTQPRSRAPRRDALPAYGRMLSGLLDVAGAEGARVRWVSPWNEPNGPWFVSPQREACDPGSPSLAPREYSAVFRAARAALAERGPAAPGLVLGELAAYERPSPHATGVAEMLRALPDDVACGAVLAAQHAYVRPGRSFDPVAAMGEALAERPCTRALPIWVTETGPGGAAGTTGAVAARSADACRAYDAALRRWHADPRVEAAFHYTFREDPLFPTGLADASLTATTPSYAVVRAWARRPDSASPPAPAC